MITELKVRYIAFKFFFIIEKNVFKLNGANIQLSPNAFT